MTNISTNNLDNKSESKLKDVKSFFFSSTAINWSVGQMEVMYSDLRDRPVGMVDYWPDLKS